MLSTTIRTGLSLSALFNHVEVCISCRAGCSYDDRTSPRIQELRSTSGEDESVVRCHTKKDGLRVDAETLQAKEDD